MCGKGGPYPALLSRNKGNPPAIELFRAWVRAGHPMAQDQHIQPLWWHLPERCSNEADRGIRRLLCMPELHTSSDPLILWYRSLGGFMIAKEDGISMQRLSDLLAHRVLPCLQIPGMARL